MSSCHFNTYNSLFLLGAFAIHFFLQLHECAVCTRKTLKKVEHLLRPHYPLRTRAQLAKFKSVRRRLRSSALHITWICGIDAKKKKQKRWTWILCDLSTPHTAALCFNHRFRWALISPALARTFFSRTTLCLRKKKTECNWRASVQPFRCYVPCECVRTLSNWFLFTLSIG